MVGVVVTGHGGFAAGMAANVKMLAGSDAELKAVDFADGMDVEVFEKQLAEAIRNYFDEKKEEKFITYVRNRAYCFSWDKIVEVIERLV